MTGKRSHDVNLVKGRSNGRVSDLHLDPVLSCVTLDRRVSTIKLVVVLFTTFARHRAQLVLGCARHPCVIMVGSNNVRACVECLRMLARSLNGGVRVIACLSLAVRDVQTVDNC